jgi:hypothetical protein
MAFTCRIRYTSYVRSILERAAQGGPPPDMAEISKRLERIERARPAFWQSCGPPRAVAMRPRSFAGAHYPFCEGDRVRRRLPTAANCRMF